MTKPRFTLLFLASLGLLISSSAQVPPRYTIATWHGFKKAAVTYTFDDNTSKQLTVAIPIFDEYEFPATLFTVTNWGPNWTLLNQAAANGHEVASHTESHPSLNTLTVANQETQLHQSQSIINSNVTNQKCLTIAYPNCNVGDIPTIQKYYMAGRICSGTIVSATPADLYRISSIIVGSQGAVKTAADFETRVTSAKNSGGWCVFLLHGIDDDGGYSPVPSSEITTHLQYMDNNRGDYWVASFVSVVKYIQEREAATLEEVLTTASIQITLSDDLDNDLYNYPLTLKRSLPEEWTNVEVKRGNESIPFALEESTNGLDVVFDAVPDAGTISILNARSNVLEVDRPDLMGAFPNPFADSLTLKSKTPFSYAVYTLDGKVILEGASTGLVTIGQELPKGTYLLSILFPDSTAKIKVSKR